MDNKDNNIPDISFGTNGSEKPVLDKEPVSEPIGEQHKKAHKPAVHEDKPIEGFGSHSSPEGIRAGEKKTAARRRKPAANGAAAGNGAHGRVKAKRPAAAPDHRPESGAEHEHKPVKSAKPVKEHSAPANDVHEAPAQTENEPVSLEKAPLSAPETVTAVAAPESVPEIIDEPNDNGSAEEEALPETSAEPVIREHTHERRRRAAPAATVRKKSAKKGKKKKKKDRILNTSIITGLTITIVVISASLVLSTGAITLGMEYLGMNKSDKEVTFNIPQGATSEDIIDLLIENNIIKNKNLFKLALKFGGEPTLYPGDITLSPNKSYPGIIELISEQRELYDTVTLTFKEGTNLRAVGATLEREGVCTQEDFLFQFNAKQDLPLDGKITHSSEVYYSMEGYFFPDTYEFYKNDSAYNVTKIVRNNFDSKITPEMYSRMQEIGMDLNEVVTLASIVQKEAGTVEDMPIVASVFLNRLKDKDTFPNLQSDATSNYMTDVIQKVETSSAILDHYKNVYDTYVCFGLPAGPICNPGLDAINAVLYPADTNYYYFCNNLKTKESFFAETYKEHQKNLKKAGLTE